MSILYLDEHKQCSNYISDLQVGFKYIEYPKGTIIDVSHKKEKHLFFFLQGSAKVGYNEFPDKVFNAGELIFLPKSADCRGEALTDCAIMMLVYEQPVKLCDRLWLESIVTHTKDIKYEFNSLNIVHELMEFLSLLKIYLCDGINCKHLHEIKLRELFLLFRGYYQKEQLAQLFFPMLGKSMDFRSKVMSYYLEVKTAKELASILGYGERRFNDLFIEEFGEPPYRWMQKQKSKHILGKLAQPEVQIKDIVYEFQFSCQSHFNKYCMKQYGNTPLQIRLNLMAKNH